MLLLGYQEGESVFLWLGLFCFGLAAAVVLARMLSRSSLRRERHRAARLVIPFGEAKVASTRALARPKRAPWFRRRGGSRWEHRARTAEVRAEQAFAVLRSDLTPHLARMMKDRLLWTLLSQRARLLIGHQASSERVTALEHRLTAIQLQLQKQAKAYEHRIVELEQELEAKDRLTRELLKVRIKLTRQALEAVRVTEH
jgi:hypothetical protein